MIRVVRKNLFDERNVGRFFGGLERSAILWWGFMTGNRLAFNTRQKINGGECPPKAYRFVSKNELVVTPAKNFFS